MAAARRAGLDDRAALQLLFSLVSSPSVEDTSSESSRIRTAFQTDRDRAIKALSVDLVNTEVGELSPSMPSNSPASARSDRSMT